MGRSAADGREETEGDGNRRVEGQKLERREPSCVNREPKRNCRFAGYRAFRSTPVRERPIVAAATAYFPEIRPMRRSVASTLLAAASSLVLAACAGGPRHSAARDPLAAPPREVDGFFAMNAIMPYHEWVAGGAARENAAANARRNMMLAREAGATSVRMDAWWGVVEPAKGQWDWTITDQVVASMRELGIEPYPILCYASAWAPKDTSPRTPEEWDEFANYAGHMAERYADDFTYYEVWNEPNIPPFWVPTANPRDYAELLKRTHAAVKAADPDSVVVAMCTAGPDYTFIEEVYRQGAADWCDAISWHHYNDKPDEAEMEKEIREIRAIMARYGDAEKPLLLTEAGLSTGPSTIVRPTSFEQQASWNLKKQLLALAGGVHSFYYFKLVDGNPETEPDGYWGLIDWKGEKKPWWHAYKAMTDRIGQATYIGNAWATEIPQGRRHEAEVQLYRRPDGEVLAAAWVRKDADGLQIRIPAAAPVTVEDMLGNTLGVVEPKDGFANVDIGHLPVWIRHLGAEAEALAAVRFDPPLVDMSPGREAAVRVTFENPTKEERTLDFTQLLAPPADSGLRISGIEPKIVVGPGKKGARTATIALDANAKPFNMMRLRTNADGRASWNLEIRYAEPFDIILDAATMPDGAMRATAEVRNALGEPVDGAVSWRVNGIEQLATTPIEDADSSAPVRAEFVLVPNEGENVLECVAENQFGGRAAEVLRVYGQESTSQPPTIDGDLGDWNDPPVVRLRQEKQRPDRKRLNAAKGASDFKGDARVLWTPTHVYVGAEVTDARPLLNPHKGVDVWKGDSMELYFGFPGPTDFTAYPPGFFQVIVSPGDGGANGFAWNFKPLDAKLLPDGHAIPGARVAAKRTEKGYDLEIAIPLSEFGVAIAEKQVIAFDMHLNDKRSAQSPENDATLIWNGDGDNWRDPSDWGAAVVLPDPAKRPKTTRSQLRGGATAIIVSADATTDPAYLTPLPLEHLDAAARLPQWLELGMPFRGTFEIATGYGFESDSWTHQTIANPRSANDFFCIDVAMPKGTPILAAAPGRIAQSVRRGDSYGNYVVIDHGRGFQSIYAHLDSRAFDVDLGEPEIDVERGQQIGLSGDSGTTFPHLHFGLHEGARASHSGANVGGKAVCPEPLAGHYGLRKGHVLKGAQ